MAAISNFGFGGNNAHLIVEEWTGNDDSLPISHKKTAVQLAVVGISVRTNFTENNDEFLRKVLSKDESDEIQKTIESITFAPGEGVFFRLKTWEKP